MSGIASRHHVLRVEHLGRQLGHGECTVLLRTLGRERCETGHKEVQPREWNHVDGQLAQIGIQLTGEPETRRHAGHCDLKLSGGEREVCQ